MTTTQVVLCITVVKVSSGTILREEEVSVEDVAGADTFVKAVPDWDG
jgi:hypothetical protein